MNDDKDIKEKIEAKKDRKCERVKNSILGVLKSEELDQIVDRLIKKESHVQITKTLLYVVTIIIAAVGFYLSWYTTYQSNKFQAQMTYNERQAQHIRDRIKEKSFWLNQGVDAMTDVRKTRVLILTNCKYGTPFLPKKQALMRLTAEFKVIKVFSKSRTIFKSDEILNNIKSFNEFDESVHDVCAKSAPSDEAWRKYSIKITNLMRDSISADERELAKLKTN